MTDLLDASIAALRTNHDQLAELVERHHLRAARAAERRREVDGERRALPPRQRLGADRSRPCRSASTARPPARSTTRPSGTGGTRCRRRTRRPGSSSTTARSSRRWRSSTPSSATPCVVDLGFLPEPVPLETFVGMRLNETSAHAWDVRVAFDADAGIEPASADCVLRAPRRWPRLHADFAAKPQSLAEPAMLALDGYGIAFADTVDLTIGTPGRRDRDVPGPARGGGAAAERPAASRSTPRTASRSSGT